METAPMPRLNPAATGIRKKLLSTTSMLRDPSQPGRPAPTAVPLPAGWPALIPMRHQEKYTGWSRSTSYRFAAEGKLIVKKVGRSAMLDAVSLAALIASLPVAAIGGKGGE
jgi:hypothetical protein